MILNLIHRPATGRLRSMFDLQQQMAHSLGLKVTVLIPYDTMFEPDIVQGLLEDHSRYGDELGIWFGEIATDRMNEVFECREPFLWLHTQENKRRIIDTVLHKFSAVFGCAPRAVGSYHLDAESMRLLHETCPEVQTCIAGCFEEGVKVFHGCNNSWYLFNEGMPWGPWYPAQNNTLRPATDEDEWSGMVAVPHLCRDLALSYEGRNDFFATHPANVQRAMANDGSSAPYVFNLVDLYRYQERFNHGFSYINVFVGPNWLSGSPNIQDTDAETQKLYYDYLSYFVKLRQEGALQDMTMSEFALWYKRNVPVGAAQIYDAKEILYGGGKEYFWSISPQMRLTLDLCQGGSIGDLRPFVSQIPRCTGADTSVGVMGSNPYLIHSQYRTGNAHHYSDGSRTTLLVGCGNETLDLANTPLRLEKIQRRDDAIFLQLSSARLSFSNGISAEIQTSYEISGAKLRIHRTLHTVSDAAQRLRLTEYVKGCWGVTEYPESLKGVILTVQNGQGKKDSLEFSYLGRTRQLAEATSAAVYIPALQTELALTTDLPCAASIVEGYLFNPYYTLSVSREFEQGEEITTCLSIRKQL